jgi:alkaline phosphatase D
MKQSYQLIAPLLLLTVACSVQQDEIHLGQGIMAGEITETSVILQTRLTASDTLVQDDLPGKEGWVAFELDTSVNFDSPVRTEVMEALADHDYIVKEKVTGLQPNTTYRYRVFYGPGPGQLNVGPAGTFRTLAGREISAPVSFVVVTGMNYYHFHYGNYNRDLAYSGPDKALGYPALEAIANLNPDYFIGTGDNVYFDHPNSVNFDRALRAGNHPSPGRFDGKAATDEEGIRKKYHVQFCQPRYRALFSRLGTYWEKDDHDYRCNDADPYIAYPVSHELGISSFREQLPVTDPGDPSALTYRTHRLNRDVQLWFLEGRDYRSPNNMEPGPEKTLLGATQIAWLKETLLASDATFKLVISPTPMVGPDDLYKTDNHVNPGGFRNEGEALFAWFADQGFLSKGLYIICGDRHWKYHATHPSGFEEFSTGALVDNNSRAGRLAGDPESTDPEGLIVQHFIEGTPEEASGGFLLVTVERESGVPTATFRFFEEHGKLLYEVKKH